MINLPPLDKFHRADIAAGIDKWLEIECTKLDNPEWPTYETSIAIRFLSSLREEMSKKFEETGYLPWEDIDNSPEVGFRGPAFDEPI